MAWKRTILFYLFPFVSRFVFWYVRGFTCNILLFTIAQLQWQVVSDSIVFNLDLLSFFRLAFSFLTFKISASRKFNLLCSLLLPDFSYTSSFAFKLLTLFRWDFSGLLTDGGQGKRPPVPKISHTDPAMMKRGTIIPYLKKIQKIYESRDSSHESCWHQQFLARNIVALWFSGYH